MLGRLRALIVKEFLAVWRDPRSRAVIVVPPILQLLVFGYAATLDVNHIATAVFNEDAGLASRDLIARFEGAPAFEKVVALSRESQFQDAIDSKDVSLIIHVGQTFSEDLTANRQAKVQLIVDGRRSNTALIILGYANDIVAEFNRDWIRAHGLPQPPASLVVRSWYNPNLVSQWFVVPGIVALLNLVVSIVVTALSVAREREVGTFEQLLVSPFWPLEILVGKAVPALIIGIAEASVIIVVAVAWFGVPLVGSLPLLYLGLVLFLLATVGVGLMISSLARTQQQAILGAFLFVVPAVILSGFATPIANMPGWVQNITLLNPMRYFLIIVRGVFLEGISAHSVFDLLWPMALIAAATLTSAGWLFRHRMQ